MAITRSVDVVPEQKVDGDHIGSRLRRSREATGLSLREVARRVGVSPSFISQVERGKANPSVGTLYALVSILGTSIDELMGGEAPTVADHDDRPASVVADATPRPAASPSPRVDVPLQRAHGRPRVQMSGVTWERLTHQIDPYVDFLHVEYEPGSMSCPPEDMMRHRGREYGHVTSGRLDVQVGFETYCLQAGDSIHFDSLTPHRLSNPYDEPCTAIWVVLADRDAPRMSGVEPATSAHLPGIV